MTFPEYLDLKPFLAPRKELGREGGRGEGGGEVYVTVVCRCGAHREYGASLSVSFFPLFLELMVYYSLEAIMLRTLRSLRPERIHKDGQSLILWRMARLRNRHKASLATNGKGGGRMLAIRLLG